MSHLDPEQLALIALGEPVASDEERAHLASCRECTAEVAEMTHAVVVARSTMDETQLDAPPARVWDRIAEELALSPAVAANPLEASAEPRSRVTFSESSPKAGTGTETGTETGTDIETETDAATAGRRPARRPSGCDWSRLRCRPAVRPRCRPW